jgi:hypothetical protein
MIAEKESRLVEALIWYWNCRLAICIVVLQCIVSCTCGTVAIK